MAPEHENETKVSDETHAGSPVVRDEEETSGPNHPPINSELSIEEKLRQLETKFTELEQAYAASKASPVTGNPAQPDTSAVPPSVGVVGNNEEKQATVSRVRVRIARLENGERKYRDPDDGDHSDREKQPIELRKIYWSDEQNYGELDIHSKNLCKLLKSLLPHVPVLQHIGDKLTLESPYEPLILNWDKLWTESLVESEDGADSQVRSDLHQVLKTIKEGSGDGRLDQYLEDREDLKNQKSITFQNLWTIFPPGEIVYSQPFLKNRSSHEPNHQIFIVEDNYSDYAWPWRGKDGQLRTWNWRLKCLTYDHNGTHFARRSVWIRFDYFGGPKPITSLPCYPITAIDTDKYDLIKTRLLDRGKQYRKFCMADERNRMFRYSGDAIFEQSGFRSHEKDGDKDTDLALEHTPTELESAEEMQRITSLTESDVMVDFKSYFRYGAEGARIGESLLFDDVHDCECKDCAGNDQLRNLFKPHYDKTGKIPDSDWEDFQLMLCPPRVLGYVLKDKAWAQFSVNQLSECAPMDDKEVMHNLHLSGKHSGKAKKEMLLSMVRHHDTSILKDHVAEKGEGRVFLLYGEPGVGKTSTAQMIARATQKPLFQIGVADVGTKAKEVESNLKTIFSLATTWGAILLIDEADVFLQSRMGTKVTGPSAEGSALVSVFLRVLEYYRGILFLTTNQIAQFDIAVQSRVHIALQYEKLNEQQSENILLSFVNQYKDNMAVSSAEYKKIEKYAESEEFYRKGFDGRQIRNIVGCAMSHAKGQKEDMMTLEHIKAVAAYVENFKTDLAGQRRDWLNQQSRAGVS